MGSGSDEPAVADGLSDFDGQIEHAFDAGVGAPATVQTKAPDQSPVSWISNHPLPGSAFRHMKGGFHVQQLSTRQATAWAI